MDTFTLVTGLASIFGFAIQAFDLFPKFGRARQTVFQIIVGIFVGSLLRAIDPSSVRLNVQITGFSIILATFVVVITGFLIAAAFSENVTKRGEFYGIAGIGFGALMFVLLFGSLFTGQIESPNIEKGKITIAELNLLADHALQNKNFERALLHLRSIKNRIPNGGERSKIIKEKIRKIEMLEIK